MWGVTMWLALLAASVLVVRPLLHQRSKAASIACHVLMALPFFALASRFLVNDTSYAHVVSYGGEGLPLKYRFAATWAAREGPLLLWVMWMTLLAYVWRTRMPGEFDERTHISRLRFVNGFSLLLLLLAWNLDPFKESTGNGIGQGLNELLQTDLMVIHPPLIFLAYSLCLHISAVALSSMFGEARGIRERMLHIVRPALFVSTLGIGLGGLWAYLILDWGGYWAWDPVETGSLLPWLALVLLSHLRTRPGTTSDKTWIGAGLAAGGLALFATLVTRAGGVWASSVHTFVTNSEGTAPTDAFSRMLVLKNDSTAGVEVMTYLVVLLLFIGFWLQLNRQSSSKWNPTPRSQRLFAVPFIGVISALLMRKYLETTCETTVLSACPTYFDPTLFAFIPSFVFASLVFAPLAVESFSAPATSKKPAEGWSFSGLFVGEDNERSYLQFPLLIGISLLMFSLTDNYLYVTFFLLFFTPLFYADDATKEWALGAGGVVLGLAGAWSGMVDVFAAAMMMLFFILPWMVAPESEQSSKFSIFERKSQQKVALWCSVLIVGTYLILTIVLLLSSIDSINFEGHELYGTPFVMALAGALFLYSNRRHDAKRNAVLLIVTLVLSIVFALWQPTAFGMDSSTAMSSLVVRGVLAWMTLPIVLLVIVPMAKEVLVTQGIKRSKEPWWRRIPLGAHAVHLGLLLLLLGHVYTTVLVDRGDASHRVTMIKDETVIHGNYGYEFTGLRMTSEDLEVGDGYVGIQIDVYAMDDGDLGEKIGTVEPGMMRFDTTTDSGFVLQSKSRSEVDTLTRWSGDIVFIFDGSQANGLMQQTAQNGSDSIQLVRVTVYDLPASHLVWLGWTTMLFGMGMVVFGDISKNRRLNDNLSATVEEE
ncbi:MAG: cytochrome c biogenesis protein CcsA [Candidatus Poseidoniaceae archaeon]|nr:cytochrome c biogenesis protein CcsA [Candidatus Poseidoniaceae archaeon]